MKMSAAKHVGSAKSYGGNWAVVMTGGRGTRFWPESRNHQPKPFLKLLGNKSLLEETVHRLGPMFPPERIVIVLQDSLVGRAKKLFPRIPKENLLGEPVGRNTAPCCVYAAAVIAQRDPGAKMIFLPADQYIHPESLYRKTLKTAFQIVDEKPVLLGMRPDSPHTGYGYLELGARSPRPKGGVTPPLRPKKINGISYYRVKRIREKPALNEARRFLKKGNFVWNGGTFIWRLDAFKDAVKQHYPRLYPMFEKFENVRTPLVAVRTRAGTRPAPTILKRIYKSLPSISLDYAVMEKMKNVHCLISPFEWKDLGGWLGAAQFWPKDKNGNRIAIVGAPLVGARTRAGTRPAPTLFIRAHGNIVKSGKRLVALLGVQDLLVVDTGDALLICPHSEVEKIREIVHELEKRRAHHYL